MDPAENRRARWLEPQGRQGDGARTGWGTAGSGLSEEAGDGSEDFENMEDAGDRELLFVEVVDVDGDVAEDAGSRAFPYYLYGAQGVEDNGVDLAILDIVNSTFAKGYDIAVVYLGFHRVAGDVAPQVGLLETGYDDVTDGNSHLAVEDFAETSDKIYVVVWNSLPYFLRNSEIIRIFVAGCRSLMGDISSRGGS